MGTYRGEAGRSTVVDKEWLQELEDEASALREQLATVQAEAAEALIEADERWRAAQEELRCAREAATRTEEAAARVIVRVIVEATAKERLRCMKVAAYHRRDYEDVASNLPKNLARAEAETLARLAETIERDVERGWEPGEAI